MTLIEFAKLPGCIVDDRAGKGWGGAWQYSTVDHPDCYFCGFKTEDAAYRGWLFGTFGETTAKAVLKLLKQTERKR